MEDEMVDSFGGLPKNACPTCGAAPLELCYVVDGDRTVEIPNAIHKARSDDHKPNEPRELNMLKVTDAAKVIEWFDECVRLYGSKVCMAIDESLSPQGVVIEENPRHLRVGTVVFKVITMMVERGGGSIIKGSMEDMK